MLSKKKEDRIKSAQSNSPYGRKSKEGTFGGPSGDGKQIRISIWPEWSEADVNNEKWDVPNKTKEKDKTKSPQMTQSLFDDPDGRLRMPPSLRAVKWKRSSEYFTKNPVIVDTESGIHRFDLFNPNKHLFVSETMRWIICQINNLWITSEKKSSTESENQTQDVNYISPDGTYHTWKFWEHIYALNKVGKGLPQYNPAGKYIVKLFWMGEWRKILVDDTLPFDKNDQLLLPITSLKNELWPVILSKALLKVASLSYGYPSNDTEFGDFSVIHSLTGWIPQKKIISKEHQNQVWTDLTKLLTHWIYPDGIQTLIATEKKDTPPNDNQHVEVSVEKTEVKEANPKDKSKKDTKDGKPKEKKEKEKSKAEKTQEGKFTNENPETLIFASYTSMYNKLNMVSTSKMADHSESLRKIGISQIYSHPVLLNFYRDSPLVKNDSVEQVPAWKLIRPLTKPSLPLANDCITHTSQSHLCNSRNVDCIDKFVEIQSPFLNYKISSNSLSKSPIENIDEDATDNIEPIMTTENRDYVDFNKDLNASKTTTNTNANISNFKSVKPQTDSQNEEDIPIPIPDDDKPDFNNQISKSWIDINMFNECFQVIYVYHKTETYHYGENFADMKSSSGDQKEPMYLFADNTEPTEIIFCLTSLCKWFTLTDTSYIVENQTSRNSPSITILKDTSNNFDINTEMKDCENVGNDSSRGMFIAETHNWTSFKIGKCFKRTQTNGTKAISLKFPPGRHCLRIFIQSPHGFHCKMISQNQFHFGNEDDIMRLSVEEPKRIVSLGLNVLSLFNNIITSFSNAEERKLNERSFIDFMLGFSKTQQSRVSTSEFMQIFSQAILKILSKTSKDIITPDVLFSLRVLNLDFGNPNVILNTLTKQNLNSNRNSAKVPANNVKGDNRKQSSTKPTTNVDAKADEKKTEFVREFSSSDMCNIIRLQKCMRGFYVRKIIEARNFQSKYHGRIVTELNKVSTLIEQNTSEMGVNLLNELIVKYPPILKHYELEKDKLNHICLQEFNGTSNLQLGSGFGILFREIFHINSIKNSLNGVLIKINCNTPKCVLSVINNDNGEIFSENILKRLYLPNLRQNFNGYTLIGLVKDVENVVNWKVKIICDGNNTLPSFAKQELCSDFTISKIRDYYIPEDNGLLFQQMVKVKADHPVSIFVKLSNPDIHVRLSVFNFEEEIYFTEGVGETLIPSFIFSKDQFVDDQTEASTRSPSRNSNKSRKHRDKTERHSARHSRTNSSSSSDENKINKYSIQAFVNPSKWSLSKANEEFVDKLRKTRRKDINENKIINESPSKVAQNTEASKKETSQKPAPKTKGKEKGQDTSKISKTTEKSGKNPSNENTSRPNSTHFESDKANWTVYIISEASLDENIQIFKNNEKYDTLCAMKKVWLELDPSRFEKGKQIQQQFNELNQNREDGGTALKEMKYPKHLTLEDVSFDRLQLIESFRQQQSEWIYWCQNEKVARTKKITDTLNSCYNRQKIVDSHRLNYFKTRERVKQAQLPKREIESK